jgi:hypothetical chaperone protein
MSFYAIDFGTSNSLLSYVSDLGVIVPVPLNVDEKYILRSLLFTSEQNKWFFGEDAIEQYIEHDGEGRFFRSLKKFLPEPTYNGTEVHNKKLSISELIATFLREMRERADKFTGKKIEKVILGRPALYSSDQNHDQLAEDRMKQAAILAGFKEIIFCPEPLAAGLDFDKSNSKEKIVLVADFGGGTSDFTLMKLHSGQYSQDDILGISGIFKAGDALDGEMMLRFVSKNFGSDFEYKMPIGNNTLRFPRNLLKKICSPAHITHLRERDTWEFLQQIQKFSLDEVHKKKLDQLFALVEYQLGFPIFDQMEKSKIEICSNGTDPHLFKFKHFGVDIQQDIGLDLYNEKMNPVVNAIIGSMMDVFSQAGLKPEDVDEVCLTGGTAQFNLIQHELENIFGHKKLIEHNIYQSVVGGLAQFGQNLLSK